VKLSIIVSQELTPVACYINLYLLFNILFTI